MTERTLTIIKPDAVESRHAGHIISLLEEGGFRILAMRRLQLNAKQAEGFYSVHRERPFFSALVAYMTSGPVYVMALERADAIALLRKVMGSTDPAKAEAGTIRKLYGESIERNCVHGSDSPANAAVELAYFFPSVDLV